MWIVRVRIALLSLTTLLTIGLLVVLLAFTIHSRHKPNSSNSSSSGDDDDNVGVNQSYDPAVAWSGLHFCKAAYCPSSSLVNWSCGAACTEHPHFSLYRIYENITQGTSGYIGVDTASQRIVVAFRGSYNTANWIEDLSYWATSYPSFACGRRCQVHRGFYHAYLSLRVSVLVDVYALHQSYPRYSIFVTGHSLGGAIALFCALDLAMWNYPGNDKPTVTGKDIDISSSTNSSRYTDAIGIDASSAEDHKHGGHHAARSNVLSYALAPLTVYTFGEPRVGNGAFSSWVVQVLSCQRQFRITHARDVVPHLPPRSFGYVHVPQELWYVEKGVENSTTASAKTSLSRVRSAYGRERDGMPGNYDGRNGTDAISNREDDDDAPALVAMHFDARHNPNESTSVYTECDDSAVAEDANCSAGVWVTNVADHLYYLGVCTRCHCDGDVLADLTSYRPSRRLRAVLEDELRRV